MVQSLGKQLGGSSMKRNRTMHDSTMSHLGTYPPKIENRDSNRHLYAHVHNIHTMGYSALIKS